jgi:hypothetical protein
MLLGLDLAEAKLFTCLDLKDAFFCICLAPKSQTVFAFQWEHPNTRKGTANLNSVATRFQNSPTIFRTALVSNLKAFSANHHSYTLL